MTQPIPFVDLATQQKLIRKQVLDAIEAVLDHGKYILGPEIKTVEEQLADFCGTKHTITVASGTDALIMALMALNIKAGDEVITTPYTWISPAEAIALLGARPVFVDIQPDTFNINAKLLETAITSKTKAIMPVSLYGQCADMDAINAIANDKGIPVIEDAAQSFGAKYKGRVSCNLSQIGCTSFFPSKPLGCYGDGGAIFTNDDRLAEQFKAIRVHGQKRKHEHTCVGLNGRFDTIQAAVLIEKLKLFPDECKKRMSIAKRYDDAFDNLDRITTPFISDYNESVYAQYTIRVEDPDSIQKALASNNVPAVSYYKVPMHLQPVFHYLGYDKGSFPVAEALSVTGLSLPMSPYLTEQDQGRVIDSIKQAAS